MRLQHLLKHYSDSPEISFCFVLSNLAVSFNYFIIIIILKQRVSPNFFFQNILIALVIKPYQVLPEWYLFRNIETENYI